MSEDSRAPISDEIIQRIDNYFTKFDAKADKLDAGAAQAVNSLLAQAKQYRDQYNKDREAIAELEKKTKQMEDTLAKYKDLGEDPEAIKKELASGREAVNGLADRQAEDARKAIADTLSWNIDVLAQLMKLTPDITFDIQEMNVKDADGKETKEKVVYVTGSDKVKQTAEEFIEKNTVWSPFKTALVVKGDEESKSARPIPNQRRAQSTPPNKEVSDDDIRNQQSQRLHFGAHL